MTSEFEYKYGTFWDTLSELITKADYATHVKETRSVVIDRLGIKDRVIEELGAGIINVPDASRISERSFSGLMELMETELKLAVMGVIYDYTDIIVLVNITVSNTTKMLQSSIDEYESISKFYEMHGGDNESAIKFRRSLMLPEHKEGIFNELGCKILPKDYVDIIDCDRVEKSSMYTDILYRAELGWPSQPYDLKRPYINSTSDSSIPSETIHPTNYLSRDEYALNVVVGWMNGITEALDNSIKLQASLDRYPHPLYIENLSKDLTEIWRVHIEGDSSKDEVVGELRDFVAQTKQLIITDMGRWYDVIFYNLIIQNLLMAADRTLPEINEVLSKVE